MTTSANQTREARILEASSELFVHYGYDKTTVSDIARQAGVSKGTIYLHFASKDALLEGLILRELQAYAEKWLDLIEADPQGGTIAGLYKNSLYALSSSPFMAAMFMRDGRVLGNYLRQPDNLFRAMREGQPQSDRYLFVKLMQEAGAIRPDLDPKVIAHIMDMLAYGLVGLDEVIPKRDMPPMGDVIEGIATIMERALAPEGGGAPDSSGDSETGKAILRQIAQATRQRFETMRSPNQE